MPWVYLDVPFTVALAGPLHIGTGYGRGLTQRAVVRQRVITGPGRSAYHVYIPASSLKGKVRTACEDLARAAGLRVCQSPFPETMCGRDGSELCLVCRTFGAPGGSPPGGHELFWHDAELTAEWRREAQAWPSGQTADRTQVQLSRKRGMAAEDRVYTSEFATPGLTFSGRVSGWLDATPCPGDQGYYEVSLLLAGLRLVTALGGARSRGAGQCSIQLPDQVSMRLQDEKEAKAYSTGLLLQGIALLGQFAQAGGGAHD